MVQFYLVNKALRIIILANTIFVFAGALLGPLYIIYIAKLTNNILHIGTSASLFSFTTAFLVFALSKIGDKIKEAEFLLILGFILRAIGWISLIFINSIWQIYAIQVIFSFGEAFGSPSFTTLFSLHLDKGKCFNEWGFWIFVSLIISGIATSLGAIIVSLFGFKLLFAIMASLALISSAIVYFQPRRLL